MIRAGVQVPPAMEADLVAVNGIYNHYVSESHVTVDLETVAIVTRSRVVSAL